MATTRARRSSHEPAHHDPEPDARRAAAPESQPTRPGAASTAGCITYEETDEEMTKEDNKTVASTNTETEIGTALTRRPAPPKPVLTFAELMTIVWLRAKPTEDAR
jgi:hypothetical protein